MVNGKSVTGNGFRFCNCRLRSNANEDAERLGYATIRRHFMKKLLFKTVWRVMHAITFLPHLHKMADWLRVKTTAPMTETMMSGPLTVLYTGKEHGGTTGVPSQTSMDCTSAVRATVMVSHGIISMPLHQVGSLYAIQTWSWREVAEDQTHCL